MGWFMFMVFWLVAILIVSKLYFKLTTGWCRSNVCLMGKTTLITGGNSGIGYETAADFAKRGAKVILACRNATRGKEAVAKLIKSTYNPNIIFKQLDLSSLRSVREFAEEINSTEESYASPRNGILNILLDLSSSKRLDILVNNAGIGYSDQGQTEDGLNNLMQSNYFGHFLLTNLLLGLLKRTSYSRIVNVSSLAAKFFLLLNCSFDINNLNREAPRNSLSDSGLYGRSKWCNILFTIELAERLKETTTTTYSIHPGLIRTNIYSDVPYYKKVIDLILKLTSKDSQEGAQTSIYCSVEGNIKHLSGQHFQDCHVVSCYQAPLDPALPKNLWRVSEELVKLNQK